MDCIICRYGEIALKGKNRGLFEKQLVLNIRDCLRKNKIVADVKKVRGRIFVYTDDREALKLLKNVFGLISLSPSVICDNLPNAINKKVIDYVDENIDKNSIKTFRITTRRTNKSFPGSSNDNDIMLGDAVNEKFGFKVKLNSPDLEIGVEIHEKTFIFHEKLPCFGGLPLGVSGNVACLIEDKTSIAAAWLMMKRGCFIFPIGMKKNDIDLLKDFAYGQDMFLTEIDGLSAIYSFIGKNDCRALVTGDTLASFDPERYKDANTTLLTPLIAYTDDDISKLLEMIR